MNPLYKILRFSYHLLKRINKNFNLIINRLFFKIDKNYLRKKFLELGLKKGMNVYIHSSLSKFGYIEGGAYALNQVLQDIIQDGTIMMPTFTHYKEKFNLNEPCWTGKIAETFRLQKNVKRSIHATHSVVAKGKLANYLVKGHENSKAPFDENSPYAKFTKLDSYILVLGIETNSIFHYVQNKINFPNLFLPGYYFYKFKNKIIKTKLHNPKGSTTYIFNGKPYIDAKFLKKFYRVNKFHERGIMKILKIGKATCRLIKTKEFVEIATRYLKDGMKRYKDEYVSLLKN